MSKEEINLMREAMHKGVKMLIEEMEKYARENKSVSWEAMMEILWMTAWELIPEVILLIIL